MSFPGDREDVALAYRVRPVQTSHCHVGLCPCIFQKNQTVDEGSKLFIISNMCWSGDKGNVSLSFRLNQVGRL